VGTSEGARKGHTPESDSKRREAMLARWQDPEYRARRIALEADPQTKANRSAAMREANSRPEKRQHHSEVMTKKFASDEEYRAKHAEGLHRSWQDPVIAKSRADATRRAWLDHPELFTNSLKAILDASRSPEGRERQRSAFARRAAAAPTTPYEHVICLVLNELEIPYFVHKVNEGKEMDLYVPSNKLDIEVDGVNHSGKGTLRDKERDVYLMENGYRVLRIKHRDILNGSFIAQLQEALKQKEGVL
jgi:very-short-patch-repair endonuclease